MKRIAIFVEGQTELVFLERLVGEFFGFHLVGFQKELERAGKIVVLRGGYLPGEATYLFLLVNCEGDGKVVSAIRDRAPHLAATGYDLVLGVRDLYPLRGDQCDELRARAGEILDALPGLTSRLLIAVMEIEAWFLLDRSLPLAISDHLSAARVLELIEFDLVNCDVENIPHPAVALDRLYSAVGGRYKKRLEDTYGVVTRLDVDYLYIEGRTRCPSFNELVETFEGLTANNPA